MKEVQCPASQLSLMKTKINYELLFDKLFHYKMSCLKPITHVGRSITLTEAMIEKMCNLKMYYTSKPLMMSHIDH